MVEFDTGEILSVDGILLEGNNVLVDESSLTGETIDIKKRIPINYDNSDTGSPFMISSSMIM